MNYSTSLTPAANPEEIEWEQPGVTIPGTLPNGLDPQGQMGYSTPTGLVWIRYETVGCRLRLFTFIPAGDEMM